MKIAIVAPSGIPYAVGGAEKFWWGMLDALNKHTTHEVELIKVPSPEGTFWDIIASYQAFSELDLSHFDLLISTKYPAWMVGHHNHYCYLQHTLRGLYDTYPADLPTNLESPPEVLHPLLAILEMPAERTYLPTLFTELAKLKVEAEQPYSSLAPLCSLPGPLLRKIVHWLDSVAKHPDNIRRYFAISHNVTQREGYFPENVPVTVLHHPSDLGNELAELEVEYQNYLFTASRLDAPKRLDLLIQAFQQVDGDAEFPTELRIGGGGPELARLKQLAGSDPRIKFLGRITDAELMAQYRGALCVPFVPYDEDYGLITLEAMQAAKAVITVADSGGVNELVTHNETGLSVPLGIEPLAQGIQQMLDNREHTIAMGKRARESVTSIQWASIVQSLLSECSVEADSENIGDSEEQNLRATNVDAQRPKIVVAVSFPVFPPKGGGQNRIYHLYRQLAQHADVVLVSLCDYPGEGKTISFNREIAPGLREHRIAKSPEHQHIEVQLSEALWASVGDLVAMRHINATHAYLEALRDETQAADIVVASHHYLYPAVRQVYRGPVVYESHNVETDMKHAVLGRPTADKLNQPALSLGDAESSALHTAEDWLNYNQEIEQLCAQDAVLVTACSDDDRLRLQYLYELPNEKFAISANGVDMTSVTFTEASERVRYQQRQSLGQVKTAVFMGSWHGPNLEAAQSILDLALSLEDPAQESPWQFWLMGSVCDYWQARLKDGRLSRLPTNVRLLGMLSETEKAVVLATADLALNPMNSGSGSNLKMMEYAAAGIPVLSTPFGNRGLAYRNGRDIIERELADFATGLQAFAAESGGSRISSAKGLTEQYYRWQVIAENYRQQLLALLPS